MTDEITSDSSLDTSSTTTADVANATTQPSETIETTTQPSAEAGHEPTTPAGAQAGGDGSFPANTRNDQPQSNQAPNGQANARVQAQPEDYRKRYEDQVSYLNRLARENADHRKYREAWGDLNPQQVREMIQRQQTDAQARQLKPWQPQHPEYQQTSARLDRVKNYAAAREEILRDQGLDETTKNRLVGNLAQRYGITQNDAALYRDYEQHRSDFQDRFTRDPETAIADIVERRVQSRLEQYDAYRRTTVATEQWLADPRKQQLLEKHAEDVLWAMDDNTPRRDVGLTIAKLKAEVESLKGKLGGQRETVETANAQQAALRKRSTVTRDAVSAPTSGDPVDEGQKQGLQGRELLEFLRAKRAASAE